MEHELFSKLQHVIIWMVLLMYITFFSSLIVTSVANPLCSICMHETKKALRCKTAMNGHFETMFLVAVNVLLSICNSWLSLQSCCALTHFITNRTYNKGRGLLVLYDYGSLPPTKDVCNLLKRIYFTIWKSE